MGSALRSGIGHAEPGARVSPSARRRWARRPGCRGRPDRGCETCPGHSQRLSTEGIPAGAEPPGSMRARSPPPSSVLTDKGINKKQWRRPKARDETRLSAGGGPGGRPRAGRANCSGPKAWPRPRSRVRPKPRPAPGSPASPRPPAETLPAPELSAEPATLRPAPGALVQLRCRAPRAGLRFALVREDAGRRRVHSLQSPAGAEARFELRDVSLLDSANYSCVYADTAPPFEGSAPSARVELRVDGEWARATPPNLLPPGAVSCPPPLVPQGRTVASVPPACSTLYGTVGLAVGGAGDAWHSAHVPGS